LPRAAWLIVAFVLGLAAILVGPAHHHTLALAASAVALLALAVAAWDVETALAFLLVFMPFRTLVAAVAPLPLRFAADVVVLVLAVRVLVLHPQKVLPLDAIEAFGLLFIVVGLVATVHAHVRLAGAALEIRDLFLFWLLYAAVRRLRAAGAGPSPDFWERAVPLGLAAIAVVGAHGLLGLALGQERHFLLPGPWLVEPISRVNQGRPYGLVNNPNIFGELGFIGLALTYARLRASSFRPLVVGLVLIAFFLAMVVFSYSRTAWIITAVAIVAYLVAARGAGERASLVVGLAVLLVSVFALPHAQHRVAQVASRSALRHSAKAGRLETLRLAASLVRHDPLGTGLGTFGSGAARVFHQSAPGIPHRFYADDNYAAILVESGVAGFLLFLLTGLAVYRRLFVADAPADDRLLVFVLFAALTVIGATANAWEELNLTVYPWLALAVLTTADGGSLRLGRVRSLYR
jgi:hypothetical protein